MDTLSPLDHLLNTQTGWLTVQSARDLVNWVPSDELRSRVATLGEKANRGELSPEEDAEYRNYIDEAELISLLQLKARRQLAGSDSIRHD